MYDRKGDVDRKREKEMNTYIFHLKPLRPTSFTNTE